MPFNAPAPVPNLSVAHSQPCDEKRTWFSYTNSCSNRWNYVLGFARDSHSPNATPADFRPQVCFNASQHPFVPGGYEVCRYCIAATEDKPWFKQATTYFRKKPSAYAESNRSRHYLTRLCRLCEHREEVLLAQLEGTAPNSIPPQRLPSQFQRNLMAEWPRNRCTCEKLGLYNNVRCFPHRRDRWDTMRVRFVAAKRRHKNYLIHTKRVGDRRVDAMANEMKDRIDNGRWRACRCGEEPVATTAEATVMQCMCCKGIVHFVAIPGGPQPAFGTPPPPNITFTQTQLSQNSITTPGRFSISVGWGNNRNPND